jgi:group I intron endonuclease
MICQNEIQTLPLVNLENKPENEHVVSMTVTENDFKKKVLTDTTTPRKRVAGIYKIVNRVNGKYYVGSSTNIFGLLGNSGWDGRMWQHKNMLSVNRHTNIHLQRAWNKQNSDDFEFLLVEECDPTQCLVVEQKHLDIAKKESDKCYNMSFIAERVEMTDEIKNKIRNRILGLKRSDETKRKIGLSKIGNKNSLGRKMSDDTKQKLACASRGNKNCLGRKMSAETKLKLRMSHIGKNTREQNSSFDKTIYRFRNQLTSEEFFGVRLDFYTKYHLDKRCVSSLIKNKLKSYKGWILVN